MIKLALFCFLFIFPGLLSAQHDSLQWKKMRALDFLAGHWQVETESRLSLNGPWEKSTGKSFFQLTLDSTLLEEEYTGTRQGKPFLFKAFFAVNNTNYKYQRVFIDAPHGVMLDFAGEHSMHSVVFDKHHIYKNGNWVELRVVYKKVSANEFTVESMRMPQGATVWDVTGRMRYKR
jgi:Protein of unknown function (DUF1579)